MKILKLILKLQVSILLLLLLTVSGCKSDFELNENLKGFSFTLSDQDGKTVKFPADQKDKIIVVGFIFTHCPDICPLTVNNMQLVQNALKTDGMDDVEFIAISFDPERDTVALLKKFAALREIDERNFKFLTGTRKEIDSLMSVMRIVAVTGDTTMIDGSPSYFYTHTDRISIIDRRGFLRKEYPGSKANIEEIVNDIKKLR
ncbi:MAG: SCO family protein [Ignavibacteriales bacterium]|jgi:protein SCO1/2|nr:SCO family protein [Ignavibacteriales bacterium]MBP7542437.1 SCO family protein [Ignavibacteriaceae bacterium]MBK7266651.1 SCO family protein [Ignavibacteriales bacterium]MBK8660387.1 SCO family protein [Ignavibacteriales bacterium]MBP9122097.1 SCO family protein [Ignavibacteriaceae bacterium]